ncbi:hypothetical protein DPMN_019439 [Dreissena polymorpha]|uniref:Uncharacterized protein n=1 Tax=Dreissena polymorpha TaxID=45954 RepID=A0A9D4NF19_DREPO|nr:hypothetical protein DPMN_019439 [Dreissena polymorpha]
MWRKYGADLWLILHWEYRYSLEHRGDVLIEGPRGGGTQYAQRNGETVAGMKTTAGDSESGHKGRAVSCRPLAELRPNKNLY